MTTELLPLSSGFETATEADWMEAVTKALKGGGIDRITRQTRDGLTIKPLYRETDYESASDHRGAPGDSPFLRSADAEPDHYLPWDIRQTFTHPNPAITNAEILRDLERGVSSVLLSLDCSGEAGCVIGDAIDLATALKGVRADLATVALSHRGAGSGVSAAALVADWAGQQDDAAAQRIAFNISPITQLIRTGKITGGIEAAFARTAALTQKLAARFPLATSLMAEALTTHEAGGTEAQELGVLMAHAVDTLRRLDAAGLAPSIGASQIQFIVAADANYGIGIAKIRTARRLWARVQDALNLSPTPMNLHAVSSARMLTKYDPWVNMLRNASACFAASVGGADIITVRAFNESLGVPEELGRRIARNTQIIAMEESGLGRIADPSGGAWFSETLSEDLAEAAWSEFQTIEAEGGLAESLITGKLQSRITEKRAALMKDVSRRKVPVTGVSEFPLLDAIAAPVSDIPPYRKGDGIDPAPLKALIGEVGTPGDDTVAEALQLITLAEPFEALRDRAEAHLEKTGTRPSIYLAALGPLAEHTARADFARNLFAAGGIEVVEAESFEASGCSIAVICGSDKRYEAEAADAAKALKAAGARRVWLAGKLDAESIDSHIRMGCDVVHECTLALAEMGVK